MKRAAFLFLLTACSSCSPPSDAGNDAASGVDGAADVATEGAPACKHAGDTCSPNDACNTWSCKCANISSPEITVGSCTGGTCQSGTAACTSLCSNAGGVTSATDDGC